MVHVPHIIFKYYSSANTIEAFRASFRSRSIRSTYESLIFSSAFDLAIYSVFIAQFECPISDISVCFLGIVLSFCLIDWFDFRLSSNCGKRAVCSSHLATYSSCFIAVFIGTVFYRYPLITSCTLAFKTRIVWFLPGVCVSPSLSLKLLIQRHIKWRS